MKRRTSICSTVGTLLIASLFGLMAGIPAAAQLPPGPQPPVPGQPEGQETPTTPEPGPAKPWSTIAVETTLVNVDVLVTDEDGRVLSGLKKDNFRISDNGREQVITNFAPVEAPITIVMLVEYSRLAYDYFAYKATWWGARFLNHLDPQDYVALVTYDVKPTVRVDFTRNKAAVRDALAGVSYPSFREANLYDALMDTLERLDRVRGKKSILLITTGADTFSRSNFDEVRKRLREEDSIVFCVGIAEAEVMRAEVRGQVSSSGSLRYLQQKNQLNSLAKMSGGHAWFPRFEGELPAIFGSVAVMLRNRYRLGFSPPESLRDGKYHKLKVRIVGPDGKLLKVTDYKGKRRKVEVYAREGYMAKKPAPKK